MQRSRKTILNYLKNFIQIIIKEAMIKCRKLIRLMIFWKIRKRNLSTICWINNHKIHLETWIQIPISILEEIKTNKINTNTHTFTKIKIIKETNNFNKTSQVFINSHLANNFHNTQNKSQKELIKATTIITTIFNKNSLKKYWKDFKKFKNKWIKWITKKIKNIILNNLTTII